MSEGFGSKKWTIAQEEKVCSHEAVGIESANYGMSGLRQADRMLSPIGTYSPRYAHQTFIDRQTDREMDKQTPRMR